MKYLIDTAYLLVLLLISPKIIYRAIKQNRYRAGWSERFGKVNRKDPAKKCIWIHAVSVGEVNAAKTLVEGFGKELGDYEIVISATTDTGYARAKAVYGDKFSVFYYPADISWIVKRAFKRLKPDVCLLMELEVWPNFAAIAEKMGIPVVVVNGRLSDKSFPRYKLIKPATKWMFGKMSMILAQTEEYAQRFIELGCPAEKVKVTSSLKYDTAQVTGSVEGTEKLKEQIDLGDEMLWVAGGTGPGEEAIVLDVFKKLKEQDGLADLRVAIIPRKPERFDEAAELINASGFSSVRYSSLKENNTTANGKPDIILGDTMGDLKKFYSLATAVFVGRTMVPMGGSDMMEPAALGKFTSFGPHTFNFKQAVDALGKGDGAVEVKDSDELFEKTGKALCDKGYAETIAAKGQEIIKQNQGATARTIEEVRQIVS
jgi:3-deoxy-D-manno-octulosonic-acid transferase